jgi:diguanylate cyclase (GGDEF)-like protein
MPPLLDLLLTTDPVQRVRLAQTGLGMATLAVAAAAMQFFVLAGLARAGPVAWWTAATLGGLLAFFLAIRSGWSRRLREPAMAVAQMAYALACTAVAYTLLGPARGAVFPLVMVILMFGMLAVTPRQMAAVSVYTVLLFGAATAGMALARPDTHPAAVEAGHFLMVGTMVPAAALLVAHVARMRQRLRLRRGALADALQRIRDLATRDELTGLVNRRHMGELIEQERLRCVRSGQTFCLARLDIDAFKLVNERHGYAVGDTMLRSLAQEAQRQVRGSDLVARWSGEEFMLMMPDTRATLARAGLERLVQQLGALQVRYGSQTVAVTLSAGLAQHHAGESIEDTLGRVSAALAEAKADGGRCVRLA